MDNIDLRSAELSTATRRVHRWRIVERPLDIHAEVTCEISGSFPTNKQSRTNNGLSTRVQEVGGGTVPFIKLCKYPTTER